MVCQKLCRLYSVFYLICGRGNSPVYNYTSDFNFLWDEIRIPVTYDSDYKYARQLLKEVSDAIVGMYPEVAKQRWMSMRRRYKLQNASLDPIIYMSADDRWIEFRIRYIVDAHFRSSTKDRLYESIVDAFQSHKDTVRIASQSIVVYNEGGAL